MMAVVRDRFIELVVDCGLGSVTLIGIIYAMLTLFRRNRKNDDSDNGPRDTRSL